MSKSQEYIDEFSRYVIMEPYPFVVDIKKSKGMWLYTVDGDKIFDWAGYYGSKLISHNHDGMFEPDYIQTLIYAANNKVANPDFLTPECVSYYRKLYEIAPKCMKNDQMEVYVINSGAEAMENMMKYFINLYDQKQQKAGKTIGIRRFIYFDKAFHGRTVFALNITRLPHAPNVTKNFEFIYDVNIQVPFPVILNKNSKEENFTTMQRSLDAVEKNLKTYQDEIVGIIVEPIQGAGGHRMADPEFFRRLSILANKYDVYLGFDEVQTAGGQTGAFFAIDNLDLPYPPQGLATGKKLGNGVVYMLYPMEDKGILDSTWGGSLTDMVRFCQEMKIVEREGLIEKVPQKAALLVEGLTSLQEKYPDKIFNIRGMGLYQGFSVKGKTNLQRLINDALEKEHMLLLEAGSLSVRLRPVLDVTEEDIQLLIEKLNRCLHEL
ncbi:MAG TPA: aminotransferase class III-fold pyridoxal phosphate-dependent enzyme [Bacteroidales bacterium]